MGNWQLEIGKMALYITFPVMMFHYFNQPHLFEDWVIKTKREMYPPEDPKKKQEIQRVIEEMRLKQEAEQLRAMERSLE